MKVIFLIWISTLIHAKTFKTENYTLKVNEIFSGDEVIWGFDFLDKERILFSEREGALWLYNQKSKKRLKVTGLPIIKSYGQGGLLDVLIEKVKDKVFVYLTYSKPIGDNITTALAKAQLSGNKLINLKDLFIAKTDSDKRVHFGSRIVLTDNKIFLTVGDRGKRQESQNTENHHGTVVRLNRDGSIPKDNPLKSGLKSIWSYGHRNPQGLAMDPFTKELWSVEFGPRGGDEINHIKPGVNYGWPVITYGSEFWGPSIGTKTKEGMEQPVKYYTPSISPSGMTFYKGETFRKWQGNMLIAALGSQFIMRVTLKENKFVSEERMLIDINERIRQVRVRDNGLIYFSTDSGKIYEISK